MDHTGQFCALGWAQNGRVWAKHLHCCIINSAWLQASQEESEAWSLPCPWLYSVAISFLHILWCFPQLLWSHAHVGTIWWHRWHHSSLCCSGSPLPPCAPFSASIHLLPIPKLHYRKIHTLLNVLLQSAQWIDEHSQGSPKQNQRILDWKYIW